MKVFIYTLKHPITNEIRYVGKTVNCKDRLYNHIAKAPKFKRHSSRWINSLLKENLMPVMEILEECNEYNWEEKECYWIAQFTNLTNHTLGGEGRVSDGKNTIKNLSEETVEIIINKAIELTGTMSDVQIEKELGLSKGFICRARTGRIKYINELNLVIPKSQHPKGNGGANKGIKLNLIKPRKKDKTLTYLKDRDKWRIMHYVNDKRKVFGMYNTKEEALLRIP
jgi:hypothetical protein